MWIRTVLPGEAVGRLRAFYEASIRRAGRVFHIVRAMSPSPPVAEASMGLYVALMKGASPLSRRQRELLAVVVSRANRCHY